MRAFLDTNILLDGVLSRDKSLFSKNAAAIIKMGREGTVELCMSILSISTIAYVIKNVTSAKKKSIIQDLCSVVHVLPSLPEHVDAMLKSPLRDIEDAFQLLSAKEGGCDLIVTRDLEDFRLSDIPAIAPEDFLSRILE